ncbi:PilZ domain-containing protein [Aliibacillus thermotolerans]|uniref:PilZ domain-containing protein n=1 Tax=Aliibacillus thermotolerans TaxID=1834418 RepID=A0ABW0U6P7_9BACI|nr:PilZ domain-containing protein [Aliibacillus thermotolerans]MDA3129435.1 hypothetical protein [Aliibacillus thermotolerans]
MDSDFLMILFLCLFLVLFLITIVSFAVEIQHKKRDIQRLKKTIAELEKKLNQKHYRQDHRVEFTSKKCTFEIIRIGNQIFQQSERKQGQGDALDISRSGLKLLCRYDLPVRKKIILQLKFHVNNKPFVLTGKIVRKEETLEQVAYGIQFIGNDEKLLQQLAQQLQKVEVTKVKQKEMRKSVEREENREPNHAVEN